ncbi:MAG: hypothetical protein J5880_02640 [Bacilli bacterium]|nr:hypothetical protein [Bacilli bacterium]MBO4682478.1 hypothetical protein [Bacilli bacterium]
MEELDDDTLIALIKKGDTHAETLLCAKYWVFARNLGKKFASVYADLGLTVDDFSAVAFSSIVIAMKKYKPNEQQSFKSYWTVIAKNQCINFVHDNSFIDFAEQRPISLDSQIREDGLTLHETCGSDDYRMTFGVTTEQLYNFIASEDSPLSQDEKVAAYYMFLQNYDFNDLKMLTKWTAAKVYRVAKKARKKVSNFFKSGYFKY